MEHSWWFDVLMSTLVSGSLYLCAHAITVAVRRTKLSQAPYTGPEPSYCRNKHRFNADTNKLEPNQSCIRMRHPVCVNGLCSECCRGFLCGCLTAN